jgi:S-adenosylmethionine decarboxylase
MDVNIKHKKLSAKIFSLAFWVRDTQPEHLKKVFDELLKKSEFIILNFSEHFFPVQGYTGMWLLAESHLAVHTFPEDGWTYVELSGCNESKTISFKNHLLAEELFADWNIRDIQLSLPL